MSIPQILPLRAIYGQNQRMPQRNKYSPTPLLRALLQGGRFCIPSVYDNSRSLDIFRLELLHVCMGIIFFDRTNCPQEQETQLNTSIISAPNPGNLLLCSSYFQGNLGTKCPAKCPVQPVSHWQGSKYRNLLK